jgi:hypothetical protein
VAGWFGDPKQHGLITVAGRAIRAHRLAFLWMTGDIPDLIDHADGNPHNNAWLNLRPATRNQNRQNSRRGKNNTSGFKGVSFQHTSQKWLAYINKDHKKIFLGSFADPETAGAAYARAAKELHGEFARTE